ncbi:proline-specific peptidase [Hygrophoropsis aurantiaca]|uniref:Proline-specific peptidase n=1 Tax=Hygrophoropsis aurantiaca TaxID=72124 RepID=A0ACB8A0C5_9AGAM|nr:proline-specific peptidase [Hygrophoropsis aurantiaca]
MPSPLASDQGTIPFSFQGATYQTWYKVYGSLTDCTRTPLVVLHGGPGITHDYLTPLSDLASSASIPVIVYDQLGNGRSTHVKDKDDSFWTIDLFVDELVNLLTYLRIQDNFDILGHSWGGVLASELIVRRRPEGLRHLILSNSLASMSLWDDSLGRLAAKFPQDVQDGLATGFDNPPLGRPALAKFHAVHGCTVKPVPQDVERTISQGWDDLTVTRAMEKVTRKWSIIDQLPSFPRIPTLVINGSADMSQDDVIAPFVSDIQGAQWVQFQKSSHMPFWEERAEYMDVVEGFLRGRAE